jgi:hypothetical protein
MRFSPKNFAVALAAGLGFLCWVAAPAAAQKKNAASATKGEPAGAAPSPESAAMAKMQAMLKVAAAAPTPRLGDHPDLSGMWEVPGAAAFLDNLFGPRGIGPDGKILGSSVSGFSEQQEVRNDIEANKRWEDASLRPVYKNPELAAKAKDFFDRSSLTDPSYRCQPDSVPRVGAPNEIVQAKDAVYFLYNARNIFRAIPTDGRGHNKDADGMAMGDSVGRWEGETLVVDVTSFNEDTWLDMDGSFHDANMHVVERFTRKGNTLLYEVTVEDPTLFAKPYSPKPKNLVLGKGHATEDYPCVELDQSHLVTHEHH